MTSPPFKRCRTAKGTFHFPKIENIILRQKVEQHQAIAGQSGDPLDAVMISPLTARGASPDSQAKTFEVSTGFVRRIGAWRWGRASSGRSKRRFGSRTRSWHPLRGIRFIRSLNELLEAEGFDEFVEKRCAKFYAAKYGRPSLTPGIYFRSLLIGYFEGIGAERGIAWRLADSLALRRFVGIALDEYTPDHSTISRTRRLIDLDTHREVFGWVLGVLADRGLLKGQRIAIDATTLEANAAMRSIVRRDTGASYEEFLRGLAKASGIATPTREDLARLDRKRKKRTSNKEWKSPADGDARIAKMKDGRTHLAHKAEHAVDLDTGAVVAVTLQGGGSGRHDHAG